MYDPGAVTLIQRLPSTLNIEIYSHMLALDEAGRAGTRTPVFRRIAPPSEADPQALIVRLAGRAGCAFKRQVVLEGV